MECEVCGKEIRGKGFKVIVEGSEITVCPSCKDFGTEKPFERIQQRGISVVVKRKPKPGKIEFTEELLENYNEIVRRERERRGWSQEVLAKKIQEKATLIRKIENKELAPEPEVIKKLERLFNIKLTEKVPEVKVETRKFGAPTLGDVVVIKRKKS